MHSINEETMMEIGKEVLNGESWTTFTDEEKIHILALVDASVRKYIAKENNIVVDEMDEYWTNRKKLSDL